MNELTQRGIDALRSGDRSAARLMLGAALKQDPNDATAWLWLTGALDSDAERIRCLQQVLRIDPENAAASRGLAQILERRAKQSAAAQGDAVDSAPAKQAAPAEQAASVDQAAPAESLPPSEQAPSGETAEAEEASAAAAAVDTAAASAADAAGAVEAPARKRRTRPAAGTGTVIFRTRPSLVPALLGFWTFLLGAVGVGIALRESPVLSLTLGIGLVIFLELIFVYTLLRNMSIRYELTDQTLLLRFRGKRVRLPHADIYSAECRQNFFQELLGTGDIHLRGAVKGELAELRIQNIPDCKERTKQILSYIQTAD